jgi:hypothetical protein
LSYLVEGNGRVGIGVNVGGTTMGFETTAVSSAAAVTLAKAIALVGKGGGDVHAASNIKPVTDSSMINPDPVRPILFIKEIIPSLNIEASLHLRQFGPMLQSRPVIIIFV